MKERLKIDWTTIFLALVALALAGMAWRRGGLALVGEGLRQGGQTLLQVIPLLAAAFLIAGLAQALVSQESVERWLGAGAGWRGLLLACLAGALTPGGPYVYYPIAGSLLHAGAGLGVLVAFVTAKNLWSISRLPLEIALLGTRLAVLRFALTLVVPPLMGFLAEQLFGRFMPNIRQAVE